MARHLVQRRAEGADADDPNGSQLERFAADLASAACAGHQRVPHTLDEPEIRRDQRAGAACLRSCAVLTAAQAAG